MAWMVLVINCYTEEYFVVFCAENVSVCGFNDNRNYNFFLESVLKNRVRIIYGCTLYTGKYGIPLNQWHIAHIFLLVLKS